MERRGNGSPARWAGGESESESESAQKRAVVGLGGAALGCGGCRARSPPTCRMKTLRYVLQIAFGIGLALALQLWDRRRLSKEQRARSWNTATWVSALYAFGPLSMLGWGWVTRKSALGVLLGVVGAAAIIAAVTGIDYLVAIALGLDP